jgi:hypothetical protein
MASSRGTWLGCRGARMYVTHEGCERPQQSIRACACSTCACTGGVRSRPVPAVPSWLVMYSRIMSWHQCRVAQPVHVPWWHMGLSVYEQWARVCTCRAHCMVVRCAALAVSSLAFLPALLPGRNSRVNQSVLSPRQQEGDPALHSSTHAATNTTHTVLPHACSRMHAHAYAGAAAARASCSGVAAALPADSHACSSSATC